MNCRGSIERSSEVETPGEEVTGEFIGEDDKSRLESSLELAFVSLEAATQTTTMKRTAATTSKPSNEGPRFQ
jgi:hypothetical protein